MTLLARNVAVKGGETPWPGGDLLVKGQAFSVTAAAYPGVTLSQRTAADVEQMLREQGYPTRRVATAEDAQAGAFVDRPEGLGATRPERQRAASALVREIEQGTTPLVALACGQRGSGPRSRSQAT